MTRWHLTFLFVWASFQADPQIAGAEIMAGHPAAKAVGKEAMIELDYGHHFKGDIGDTGASLAVNSAQVAAMLPIYRWGGGAIALGARYAVDVFHLQGGGVLADDAFAMHQIALPIGLIKTLGRRWLLVVGVQPYLASDFHELDADVLFVEGRVEAGWAISDALALRFGVAAHSRFGFYLPFPVLGLTYRPQGSWFELKVLLPRIVRASFRVASFLSLEAFGGFYSMVWDVNQKGLRQLGRYMRVRAGAGVKLRLLPGLYLRLWAGVLPYRRLVSYGDEQGSAAEEYSMSTGPVPFIETAILVDPRAWMRGK